MTKAELLTDLTSKTDVLEIIDENPAPVQSKGAVNWYDIPIVLDKGDSLVNGASQPILVIDEGEPSEAAYNIKKVFAQPTDPFNDELQAHADGFEGQEHAGATILKVVLNDVKPERRSGIATAYKDDGSMVTALLFKDDADNWQTQILS